MDNYIINCICVLFICLLYVHQQLVFQAAYLMHSFTDACEVKIEHKSPWYGSLSSTKHLHAVFNRMNYGSLM